MNLKNTEKTLIIEHVVKRLFTLQPNQALKRAYVGYLIHQVDQASRLHQYIQESETRNSGKIFLEYMDFILKNNTEIKSICVCGKGHLLSCCSVSYIAQRRICYLHGRKKIRTASFDDTCLLCRASRYYFLPYSKSSNMALIQAEY